MAYKIILDPGHGGYDNGAVYFGRMEKYDNLDLALAVGDVLDSNGVDVFYTRVEDVYVSPLERAYMANSIPADYFVSLHRNSSTTPNTYSGVQSVVYNMNDPSAILAENINKELEQVGFTDLGVVVRTDMAVLRRTDMPSVLVEVGFINTDVDNTLFDERFDDIANAIALAILDTLGAPETNEEGVPNRNQNPNQGTNSNYNMNMNQGTNPNYNPNTNQGTNPNYNPNMNQGTYPNYIPNMNQGTNPNYNPNMNQGTYPNYNPNMNQGTNPNYNPNTNQGTNPNNNPNMNQGTNPNYIPNTNQNYNQNSNLNQNESSEIDTEYREGENTEQAVYHIQLGLFREMNNARNLVNNLNQAGYPSDIMRQGDLFAVVTGKFNSIEEASAVEDQLRQQGYSTLIVRNGNR